MATPELLEQLNKIDSARRAADPALLERLNALEGRKPAAAAPAEPELTQAQVEAEIPLPTGEQMRRRAGVRVEDRSYNASPEGRAEATERATNQRRAVASGATFGLSKRAEAGVRALTGEGTYADNLERIRGDMEAYATENPVANTVWEGIGALTTGGPARAVFNATRTRLAPYIGEKAGMVAGMLTAGGAEGAARKVGNTEDFTDAAQIRDDALQGATEGVVGTAVVGGAPLAALSAARMLGKAGRAAGDITGYLTGTGSRGWAERQRERAMLDYMRSRSVNVDRVTPENLAASENAGGTLIRDIVEQPGIVNPGGVYPASYPLNEAFTHRTARALQTPGANKEAMRQMADEMVYDQPLRTRAYVRAPAQDTHEFRGNLVRESTTDMTPRYETVTPNTVQIPSIARALRSDPNLGDAVPASVRAAHTETGVRNGRRVRRLPTRMVDSSLELNDPNSAVVETTAGVVENLHRRLGSRINPTNSADVVTDLAAQRALERAMRRDAANNPPIEHLLDIIGEHRTRKQIVENFDRGYNVLTQRGTPKQEALNELSTIANPRVRTAARQGARASVADAVGNTPVQTAQNVERLVSPQGQRDALARALARNRTPAALDQAGREANQIADHIEDVGRRAVHSNSIRSLIERGEIPPTPATEILARAAITAKMTPGLGVARVAQLSGGMNRNRATEWLRIMAEDASTPAAADAYEQLARRIVADQLMRGYGIARNAGVVGQTAYEGRNNYAVGR